MRRALAGASLAALLCVPAPGLRAQKAASDGPLPLHLFEYDRSAPLDFREMPVREDDDVRTYAVSFASPRGGRATGLLFVPRARPARGGRFAGVVMQHGMPCNAGCSAAESRSIARHGAVVFALDAPFARRDGWPVRFTPRDSAEQVQLIVDLQRVVDLLVARPDVDPARLAYVGYSYGAAMGGLFAGVERRLKAYVLRAGDGGLVAHHTGPDAARSRIHQVSPAARERWLAALRPLEPTRFIHRAPPAQLFFQAATRDEAVSRMDAEALHRAAPEPKTVRWYESGHDMGPQAELDTLDWLRRTIGTAAPRRGVRPSF